MEFLRQVADAFLSSGRNLADCCFIFPNRRSLLFFQKYLGEQSGHAMLSPEMKTVNDLFSETSHIRSGDRLGLLYTLYKVYAEVTGSRESFDDFLYWGEVILSDFDDVDKYLVDASALFSNVSDLKDLDADYYSFLTEEQKNAVERFWGSVVGSNSRKGSDGMEGRSVAKESFLSLWKCLDAVYVRFRERLYSEGTGYDGMIYRHVAESEHYDGMFPCMQYVFIGLNAPNPCERRLMDRLMDMGKADFYWDYYGETIRDGMNMSSLFMKDYVSRYRSSMELEDDRSFGTRDRDKVIKVYAVPSAVGQTSVANRILEDLATRYGGGDDMIRTAVVLPDESLLMPMLSSVPERIGNINVTMGYPLSFTAMLPLVDALEELQTGMKMSEGRKYFYHRAVCRILEHPYFSAYGICGREIKKSLVMSGRIFIDRDSLVDLFVEAERVSGLQPDSVAAKVSRLLLEYVFVFPDTVPSYLSSLMKSLVEFLGGIDREFAYGFLSVVNRLESLGIEMKDTTFFRLLRRSVSSMRIPFRGEPLSGLQIMGNLETRALDFDNLIILSVNDGVYPARSAGNSLIPYNLRKGFSLPNYEFQDGVAAYYFYRLISRAKEVHLIYDTRTEGMSSGEVSRYVMQLKMHFGMDVREIPVVNMLDSHVRKDVRIPKTPETRNMLSRFLAGTEDERLYFSASALNTYIKCPVSFFYQYVMGMREDMEMLEEMDAAGFGSVFHSVMESLYKGKEGARVLPADVDALRRNKAMVEDIVENAIRNVLKVKEVKGRNLIIKALIIRYVDRTLEIDCEYAGSAMEYVASEYRMKNPMALGGVQYNFKAMVDRIDSVDGTVRLIDYKTGSVSVGMCGIDRLFEMHRNRNLDVIFQLLFYAWMFRSDRSGAGVSDGVKLCIYSLRNMFSGLPAEHFVVSEVVDEFGKYLEELVGEIMGDGDFVGTDDLSVCDGCRFALMCNR